VVGEQRVRSSRAWGFEGDGLRTDEVTGIRTVLAERFPDAPLELREPAALDLATLRTPRVRPPHALAAFCSTDPDARVLHALGRSFRDLVRLFEGDVGSAPDVVATPRTEAEAAAVLEWCSDAGIACVPFGGGTSVVGGVEGPAAERPVVTLQLRALDRVLEVDRTSRAARIQAGASGPVIEEQLRAEGLTMRFFPQSFELATLGGWIATRAGGHYATKLTHIDDLVESVRALTPAAGVWESRRLPGSGAGPSPDRFLLGSEGTLGVITEAWVRLQDRPRWRASASVRFPDFLSGAEAVRALAQSGLDPANCRLLDPYEAMLFGGGDGASALLVLGLESAHQPVEGDARTALELCLGLGGECPDGLRHRDDGGDETEDPASTWRQNFLRAPYLRDALVALGMITETFETAVTWDRLGELHAAITGAVRSALDEICGGGVVTCRITHAYPDGAAPYFTVIAPSRHGSQVAMWDEIKRAASEALLVSGGTITHHHAVGRDHRPWYDRQRPDAFATALRAAKAAVDPSGVLNPGVLLG
jgi:alkyldihydroxyacetonephosphate synthase